VKLQQVAIDVLRHPTVASKRFLITIGDRTVGGLSHRDQMVGPWQVPVADCAVTLADFKGFAGEAMSHGRAHAAGRAGRAGLGRMAVAEAITNLLAAPIELPRVKLSRQLDGRLRRARRRRALYDTVKAVGMELCPALGIGIPVGKDSLSMRTQWTVPDGAPGGGQEKGHLAGVADRHRLRHAGRRARHAHAAAARQATPRWCWSTWARAATAWAAASWRRCWASRLHRRRRARPGRPARPGEPGQRRQCSCARRGQLLAYHDRSDGGLWAAACEMAFAGHVGVA
jgi:phosphoribosylformylglycinamidine synthase